MKVSCEVDEVELVNDEGWDQPGVSVTCSRCRHVTESFGTTDASVKRCLALLREECPRSEKNFYEGSL